VLQRAAKNGHLQQLTHVSETSHCLKRHAQQLIKRVGHDAASQQVGEALLQLVAAGNTSQTYSTAGTSTGTASTAAHADAEQLFDAFGAKHVLRFGSTRVLQAAVDARLVSLEEALAQTCRREPGIFLQLLEHNVDALDRIGAERVRGLRLHLGQYC
jgi:hypothetical protein